MTEQLLPCPFCGWTEIYIEPDERGSGGQWVLPIHVGCCLCGVNIMCVDAETKEDAAEVWNRRTPSPQTRGIIPSPTTSGGGNAGN